MRSEWTGAKRALVGGVFMLAFGVALQLAVRAQQPVFRSSVELIAVDVQVMDNDGYPIDQLGPESFTVSINGKPHKVVSANFVRHSDLPVNPSPAKREVNAVLARPDVMTLPATARKVIIAVDTGSLEAGKTQAVTDAARTFLRRLDDNDLVGLYMYPSRLWVEPTTERASLSIKLGNVVGIKEPLHSYYHLKPHEIVDITAQSTSPNSFLTASRNAAGNITSASRALDPVLMIQERECPQDLDCPSRIYSEGISLATQLEREVQLSMGGLEGLLQTVAEIPGRKSVVLITGGLLVSDRADGRPDAGGVAKVMGQNAARANATVYTIHVDPDFVNPMPASRRGPGSMNLTRDRAMLGNWLEDFSRSAGGSRIDVPVGGGEFAFERVLRETSAYYLLGVEPAAADRDGLPHQLKVKVDKRGVTVRNRQWVVIPPGKNNTK
jgi:VWFA-related protein